MKVLNNRFRSTERNYSIERAKGQESERAGGRYDIIKIMKILPHWKHKNSVLFIIGLVIAIIFSQIPWFKEFLGTLGTLGYLGAVIAGMLFVSTFTVATGAVILMTLAKTLSPVEIIIFAAIGAVISDLLIFYFVKDEVEAEITPIYDKITGSHLKKLLHTKYFGWTLPVLGALIIITPLPDELGVSLLGMSEIKTGKFLLISGVSHTIGMFLLVSASLVI
jgi:hypothetical protein